MKFSCRIAALESVQFFQFDKDGNMYVFEPGAGCTGEAKLVKPGDEMIFTNTSGNEVVSSACSSSVLSNSSDVKAHSLGISSSQRKFHAPLSDKKLESMSHKNLSEDTMKKVNWVVRMYCDWRMHRNTGGDDKSIWCDLDVKETITEESLIYALTCFMTEVKKIDGSEYPAKTLYEIIICVQFHLETLGFGWKLLSCEIFKEIKFTLDNLMKLRTSQGVGGKVKKADILTQTHEEYLWSVGLFELSNPEALLATIVFIVGKGFALHAGKEHHVLCSPPFDSQFQFMHDEDGQVFIRYYEDRGLKTNKGGLKHMKIEPKEVDVYPIENEQRCPIRIFMYYLSKLPRDCKCKSFFL